MDTPEKNKIVTPVSKFEDSPVFNYINSLSPIKPVKSLHISQTFNSLSFASLPSVFTSPHVTSHKNSRVITATRYNGSKSDISTENRPHNEQEISAATPAIGETTGAIELPRALNYDSGSPEECAEAAPEAFEEERGGSEQTHRYHDMCLGEPRRDSAEDCDWEDLIADSADILIFDSPIGGGAAEGFDPVTRLSEEHVKGKEVEMHADFGCKSVLSLHRGIRRRCLDFETAGNRRRSSDETGLIAGSSISNERAMGPIRPCDSSSSRMRVLPGIGLHLNAIAASASKDCQIVSSETLPSGIQIRSLLRPVAPYLEKPLDSNSAEDGSQAPGSLAIVEFNPNSPKKKRRRLENSAEPEGCKRCNCKKSKCLKLYCECFAAGVYCIEPCACQECFNTPNHEDTVLATRKQIESRNPLAFAPKVIRSSDSAPEYGNDESSKTPASARHKRGCNCKKSGCLKKYCECFQGGVGCSINCRCEGCKNAFGRKDGSAVVTDVEADPEEEESELSKKSNVINKTSHKIEIINNQDRIPGNSALPLTPLQINSRPLIPLPFSSKGKPPRSSILSAGSSSSLGSYNQHKFAKPSILRSSAFPENRELPEILRDDASPVAGIKTLSPNSKRISPPQCDFGSPGSGRRSGRKLILQSIPSFPSLTPHQ